MLSDLACRSVVRLAGSIVPPSLRERWREQWRSCLQDLRVLIDRGELPGEEAAQIGRFCGGAFADALRLRCGRFDLHRSLGSPTLLLAGAASALSMLAACTHGFSVTRGLLTAGGDAFVPYALPIAFALLSSVAIALFGRFSLRGRNWRSGCF